MFQDDILQDFRVIELASVLAGPYVGQYLAECGAQVIKYENPHTGGDLTRHWKLPNESAADPRSAYYESVNQNKEAHMLDITSSVGREKLMEELSQTDILLMNFKPASAERLGLTAESIQKRFPELIIGEVISYRHRDASAFDILLQAQCGYLSMTGTAEAMARMPVALIDVMTGQQLVSGILRAVIHRQRYGKGSIVRASLYDTGVSSLMNQASNYLVSGHVARPMGMQHPNIAPYGDRICDGDGEDWVLAIGSDAQWQALCQALEWISPDHWSSNADRVHDRESVCASLSARSSEYSTEQLQHRFKRYKVMASRISNISEVLDDVYVSNTLINNDKATYVNVASRVH